MMKYQLVTNGYAPQPAFPADNPPSWQETPVDEETLNKRAEEGWRVVSVDWRDGQMMAVLMGKEEPQSHRKRKVARG